MSKMTDICIMFLSAVAYSVHFPKCNYCKTSGRVTYLSWVNFNKLGLKFTATQLYNYYFGCDMIESSVYVFRKCEERASVPQCTYFQMSGSICNGIDNLRCRSVTVSDATDAQPNILSIPSSLKLTN